MSLQLIALSNISENLEKDYAKLLQITKNPNISSELIPLFKIFDRSGNTLLFTNNKYVSNPSFNFSEDVIVDFISAEIEIGKQGMPSLIEGSLKFKIINSTKLITKNNTITIPEYFKLFETRRLIMGWANIGFLNKFDELVMQSKFNTTYIGTNASELIINIGSPLTYFNKIENTLITDLKDTSNIKIEKENSIISNVNNKIAESQINERLINTITNSANPFNSLLLLYNDFLFDNLKYKEEFYAGLFEGGFFPDHTIPKSSIRNYYTFIYRSPFALTIPFQSSNNITHFDEYSNYINVWIGKEINFDRLLSETEYNNRTISHTAIIPRILRGFNYTVKNDINENVDIFNLFYNSDYNKIIGQFQNFLEISDSKNIKEKYKTQLYNRINAGSVLGGDEINFIKTLISIHIELIKKLRRLGYSLRNINNNIKIIDIKNEVLSVLKSYNIKIKETSLYSSIKPLLIKINGNKVVENISTDITYLEYILLSEINARQKNNDFGNFLKSYIETIDNSISEYHVYSIYDNLNFIANYIIEQTILDTQTASVILEEEINYKSLTWEQIYKTLITKTDIDEKEIINRNQVAKEQNNSEKDIKSAYLSNDMITLEQIIRNFNDKLSKNLTDDFSFKFYIYDEEPSLPSNIKYTISWQNEGKQEEIKLVKNEIKLKNLQIPFEIYNKIKDSGSLFQIIRNIFNHFAEFQIYLEFSIYRVQKTNNKLSNYGIKDGETVVEIFCINLITDAINNWDGGLDFSQVKSQLNNKFIVFEYNTLNSIILDLEASNKPQDSLFITFLPINYENSLLSLFKESDLSKIQTKEGWENIEKIYRNIFKKVESSDPEIRNFLESLKGTRESILLFANKVQQYSKATKLVNIINENEQLNKDTSFKEALMKFYNEAGTYPAHLLFAGIKITLKIMGLNGLASFQLFGLKNTGLYDGIYMIEKVKHYIDKTTFTTTIEAIMLNPRINTINALSNN